ncbi:hypothetical protein [Marisediminicola sp. LYQ134]|uniref:hypothetical protein n=1 Tax=unclassified Marisediminicola TaxID=2618316 RepID=UPI003983D351
MTTAHTHAEHPPRDVSRAMQAWRTGLVIVGIALIVLGGFVVVDLVRPSGWLGIGVWLLGALVIHDGIISMGVVVGNLVLRSTGRRVPLGALAIFQAAVVVGAVVALVAVPGIYKSAIGANNPTVVPLDYASNFVWFLVGLAVVTAIALAGYAVLAARRQKARPSSSHD